MLKNIAVVRKPPGAEIESSGKASYSEAKNFKKGDGKKVKTIRKKADIEEVLGAFSQYADFDVTGNKYYLVFKDRQRNGQWTLMNTNGKWSVHGKGEEYCDPEEMFLTYNELLTFLWKNRAAVNYTLKNQSRKGHYINA
ncbi:hypothetical protein [Thalassobacillus sp. C254]|uniref:hypothetical protein n=1 Tax=Thalassobacillus sp. C254 TaxID=1225341 RepID=UPI0006D27230|nr:hypothetical protein [Thalassobacillus sp. C254]